MVNTNRDTGKSGESGGIPEIDLFATSMNKKLPRYVSPMADPQAWAMNAMTFSWSHLFLYAFPPWAMIGEILRKIEMDQAEMILIAPTRDTKPWYPQLLELQIAVPI